MTMKIKFVKKFMRLAKLIGEDQNPCHSRKIGAVIVNPNNNKILGTGYNGPAPGTPHPTSNIYLRQFFWPQLNDNDKSSLAYSLKDSEWNTEYASAKNDDDTKLASILEDQLLTAFVNNYEGKPICPRRIVGAKSGERPDLCSCGHAERHAITNASCELHGMYMFCWCGVPCLQCSDSIIQAGLKMVYCLEGKHYHKQSLWLLKSGGVEILELSTDFLLKD
jgi:deoxycytidylate deaminase